MAGACLSHIEIPCKNSPFTMTHFFYSVQHQTATFYLRLFPFVIRMKSEKPKAFMAFFIHKSAPCADADVCCVPTFHRLCGIFSQPKVS